MAEIDRISQLPGDILDLIIGFLPIQDAAKTAVLSTIWRDIWSSLTQLVFDHYFFVYFSTKYYHRDKYIMKSSALFAINRILFQHKGTIIRKFAVHFSDDGTQIVRSRSFDLDQWLLLVTRKGVEEIDLCFGRKSYNLPKCVCSCSTLKRLSLNAICIHYLPSPCTLSNVMSLCFQSINFDLSSDDVFNVPMLDNLSFSDCQDLFLFNIIATNPRSLEIKYCHGCKLGDFLPVSLDLRSICTLDLDYSSLEYFVADCAREGLPLRPPALNVEYLKLSDFCLKNEIQACAFIRLLHMCPKLCKLDMSFWCPVDSNGRCDISSALGELSSVAQRHKMLRSLKISLCKGFWCEMIFIKELLASLPALENVVIVCPNDMDCTKIMEEVLHFHRRSTKAKIGYI